jgi:hypothetical protein
MSTGKTWGLASPPSFATLVSSTKLMEKLYIAKDTTSNTKIAVSHESDVHHRYDRTS